MGVSCRHNGAEISELLDIAGVGGAADGGGGGAFLAARAAHIGACLESTEGANRREHVLHATRSRSSAISRLPVSVRAFKEPSVPEPTRASGGLRHIAVGAITALIYEFTPITSYKSESSSEPDRADVPPPCRRPAGRIPPGSASTRLTLSTLTLFLYIRFAVSRQTLLLPRHSRVRITSISKSI